MTQQQKTSAPPRYRYLFGPVPSRRLGYSLGVDLFQSKVCSLNCLYCECGETEILTDERAEFVPFDDVARELESYFRAGGGDADAGRLDFVTFSGKGEPTLYSRLGDLIRLIRSLTDTPIAVITNSTLLSREDVRSELALADVVMPSLDAATQKAMRMINRPHRALTAEAMIDGLVQFRKQFRGRMDLEILFCRGINDGDEEVRALAEAVRAIRPDRVQLNTVDRPPADARALPLSRAELERIRDLLAMENVEIIGAFHRAERVESAMDAENLVFSLLGRRAVEENDLIKSMGLGEGGARRLLAGLVEQGKIVRVEFEGRAHYRAAGK